MNSTAWGTEVRRTCCTAIAIVSLLTVPLMAQGDSPQGSYFIFPRFLSYQYQSTGIAVFNPGVREAYVQLTLRWWDGVPVSTVPNPVVMVVPARGQVAKTAGELFGLDAYFDASLEVESPTPGLIAYYQAFDSEGTFIDGTDAPKAAKALVFPVVPGPYEGASELDLMNPNSRSTAVELKLWDFDGKMLGKASVSVPAGGIYRNYPESIFPEGTSFNGASHITAASKPGNVLSQAQSVMGTSLFAGFSSYAPLGTFVDVAALNAVTEADTANTAALPYFRTGAGYASTLSLLNMESSSVEATITLIANNGSPLGVRRVNLGANGGLREPLQYLAEALSSGEKQGWILIQASGRVAGALIYGRSDGASLAALPLLRTPQTDFAFPQLVQTTGAYTELSLANPTPNTSNAAVYVVAADGTTVAFNQIAVGPGKRESFRVSELVPEVGKRSGGSIYVSAGEPLFAAASVWSEDGKLLSSFLPQPLQVPFYPAPLKAFAVTGKITLNDLPAAGFRVILSGPVSGVATADKLGYYAFAGLVPGRYSMQVDQYGFDFIPSQVNFEITTASRRQDFRGYSAANAIVVQPAAIPVDSGDTTVDIFGSDFASSSTAYAGSVRLSTTFLDSSHLTAVIPEYMTEAAARIDLTVITDAGGAPEVTVPFPVFIYVDRPELEEVTADGVVTEGSSGATLTLQGTGFLDGLKVKVNGQSDGIQVNMVNETTVIALVPAQYLQHGGIYPVTVENPYPANVESNVQLLTVYFPAPGLEGILPQAMPARLEPNAGPASLEVQGYGFRRGAVVLLDGKPLSTSYCEDPFCQSARLYAQVPAEFLRLSGFVEITVQNPSPSLPSSHKVYLRIDGLHPNITAVTPGSATVADPGFAIPVIVDGTNFGPQTEYRVYKAGSGTIPNFSKSLEVISSEQIVFYLSITWPGSIGEWRVEVRNPPPGGGQSEAVSFLITEGSFSSTSPFLVSLNPQTVAVGGPSFTLTLNGTNFRPGAVAYFYYTPLATTVVSDRQIRAEVPASLIQSGGRIPISVANPDTGGISNRLFVEVR